MKTRKIRKPMAIIMVVVMVISMMAVITTAPVNATSVKTGSVKSVQVKTSGKDKLKISWKKSGNYTGARIYQYTNGKWKKYKDTKKLNYTTKKLKKNKTYKFKVRPYYKKNGKTYWGNKSYTVSARTDRSSKNNVSKIKISTYSKSMIVGKSKTFKASLTGKKLISKSISWSSSNKTIATVNNKGKVTAKKAGTCYIYARSHNGKTAKVKVTVKKKSDESSLGNSSGGEITVTIPTVDPNDPNHVHDFPAGDVCGWVNSYDDVMAAYKKESKRWGDMLDAGEITWEEYCEGSPSGWYPKVCDCGMYTGFFIYD